MISWQDFILCEEFFPSFPWDEFERKWLIENVKTAEKELENEKIRKKNALISHKKG